MAARGTRGSRRLDVALERVPWQRALRAVQRPLALLLAAGAALAAAYGLARATPAFALGTVVVEGAPPTLAREVRRALAPLEGRSLVGLDRGAVVRRLAGLAELHSAEYDRAFPHTLVVFVRPERRAAVLRSGRRSWLVSARGRVLRPVAPRAAPTLPRVWLPAAARVAVGTRLEDEPARTAVRAAVVAADEGFPRRVHSVRLERGELVFRVAGPRELRLGAPVDLPLKLAVAAAVLNRLPAPAAGAAAYLDVGTPERPVAGTTLKSEVEVDTSAAETPGNGG